MCQYEINYDYQDDFQNVYDVIDMIERMNDRNPSTDLTCYIHLQCHRSHGFGCLDWTEICDGYINCLNDGIDEKYCWEMEITECKHNEYRCNNEQCIPLLFVGKSSTLSFHLDCIDKTDEYGLYQNVENMFGTGGLRYRRDEITCKDTFLTSSCFIQRHRLISERLFSIKQDFISDDCWLIFKCIFYSLDQTCDIVDQQLDLFLFIEQTCPDMMYIPSVPILFGDIYFAYIKTNHEA